MEVPLTTLRAGGTNYPCAGGGFFRLLPYAAFRWAVRRVNRVDRQPAVFYFHPWEVDPQQPRVAGAPWRSRFRHYLNLDRMEPRLGQLLRDFRWDRMDRVYGVRAGGEAVQSAPTVSDGVGRVSGPGSPVAAAILRQVSA